MNFKRNCLLITTVLVSVFMVVGCSNNDAYIHYEYFSAKEDKHEDQEFDEGNYIKYGKYEDYVGFGEKEMGSATDVMRNFGEKKLLNDSGEQKLLVIPVEFKDFKCTDLGVSESEYIENVKKGFTGTNENNGFVSAAEYFNRSSYGKLKLDAKVVDKFYTFPKSVAEIKTGITREIVLTYYSDIIKWYEENYGDINDYVIKGLESEDNPSIAKNVPIFLVYTYPINLAKSNSDFFWAFTFESAPLTWASYSFLYTDNGKPDAHTYIHEIGHLLGLNDYYPRETGNTVPEPTGRIDMMDCSVGDETGFSKMYLDWVRPYHIKDSTEIKLTPFEQSGDLILLKDNWNKTVFDEYFIVEMYSPTGLNAYDCNIGNSRAKLPTLPGIKIYHVDARLGYFKRQRTGLEFDCYCDEALPTTINEVVGFAHDNNTYSNPSTINEANYLYELALNNTTEKISGCAQNSHLFRTGDEVAALRFSNGQHLNYKISVSSLNFKEATIKISKIA